MSNVTITISGRKYQVASAAGEEAHIERLGKIIDDCLSGQEGLRGQSEVRNLLYAALILADELHELQGGGGALLSASAGKASAEAAAIALPDPEPFEQLAARLEAIARRLEEQGP